MHDPQALEAARRIAAPARDTIAAEGTALLAHIDSRGKDPAARAAAAAELARLARITGRAR